MSEERIIRTYNCYSMPLYMFIKGNGLQEVSEFKNPKHPDKLVWQFERCNRLSEILTAWSDNKENRLDRY